MGGKKILVPSFDFKPQLGGVAHYAHELLSVLRDEYNCDIQIMARELPGSQTYDQTCGMKVYRFTTPEMAALSLPQWIWHLRKLKKSFQPDLIFCPLWFPDASAASIAQKWDNDTIPYFIAAHGMEVLDSTKNLKHRLRKKILSTLKFNTFQNAQSIFPVSHYTKSLLHELLGLEEKTLQVATNGINLSTYKSAPTSKERFFRKQKRLLTVTRLNPYKGVDMVLKSLPTLIQKGIDLEYTVIGKGADLPRLQKITQDLGLQNRVSFLGAVSQQEIIDRYNQADLFLLLSRAELPDVEGFGLVFLEAAACGLPSLGGRSGGIPDAIDDGKSGWLVEPTDQKDIERQLEYLLSNPQELQKASIYGLEMVKKRTWSHTVQKIAERLNVL